MDISGIFRNEVFSISPKDPVAEAARRMRVDHVSSLMVMDNGRLVGIITERDLTRCMAAGDPPDSTIVADYMTDRPITVGPNTGVREAAAEMLQLDVRHIPVEMGDDIVGMISLRDLLSVLVENGGPLEDSTPLRPVTNG